MTTAPQPVLKAELDDRYGRARRRRGGWIALGVVAILGFGYVGWTTVARAMDTVDIDSTGFTTVDQHAVTVQFQVTLRRGEAVTGTAK